MAEKGRRNSCSIADEFPLSEDQLSPLNDRQQEIYSAKLARFAEYLQTEGRNPKKSIGYAEKTVSERISRLHRAIKWLWRSEGTMVEITTGDAKTINSALESDALRKTDGGRYAEGSKRKFNDVLRNWFAFQGVDWQPEYEFSDNGPAKENRPDPFSKSELKLLWEGSLTYKTIPSYNNLSPGERDRWKAYLAQEFGKPKEEVRPADWDRNNNNWKIPALIRTTRSHGWRPELIGRLQVDWYEPDTQTIYIPAGEAPKNNASWRAELTDEGAHALEHWLEQRELMDLYEGRSEIWLTREGNPYDSGNLNTLLGNLMDEVGINRRGRKLVWYSFRHSIGTYIYDEYKDLKMVAQQLRQKSRTSADQYVHPLPEQKREAANLM